MNTTDDIVEPNLLTFLKAVFLPPAVGCCLCVQIISHQHGEVVSSYHKQQLQLFINILSQQLN